jgi:hypothetical protein
MGLHVDGPRDTADVNHQCCTTKYTCMSDKYQPLSSLVVCMDRDMPVVPPCLRLHGGAFCSGLPLRVSSRTRNGVLYSDQQHGCQRGSQDCPTTILRFLIVIDWDNVHCLREKGRREEEVKHGRRLLPWRPNDASLPYGRTRKILEDEDVRRQKRKSTVIRKIANVLRKSGRLCIASSYRSIRS